MAFATARSPELEEALGPGSPIVVFDKVSLAFDEKVILRDVSFTLITGHTKIILGASGAGKSTILKLILGLLKPDAGIIWVNPGIDLTAEAIKRFDAATGTKPPAAAAPAPATKP